MAFKVLKRQEKEVIARLFELGHFYNPAYFGDKPETKESDLAKLTLSSVATKFALRSWQEMMGEPLDRLAMKHHNRMAYSDGEIGPATLDSFDVPRCGMPDHAPAHLATASGSWSLPCRTEGVTFFVDKTGMPDTYSAFWDTEILPEVIDAYRRVGARMKQITDKAAANIFNSFPSLGGTTIGLASLHAGSCSSKGFCRLDKGYRTDKEHAKELLCHEWGHNWNHNHTRSGIMAPSIGQVTKFKGWEGDAAMPAWVRFTDGKPLDPIGPIPTPEGLFTYRNGEFYLNEVKVGVLSSTGGITFSGGDVVYAGTARGRFIMIPPF